VDVLSVVVQSCMALMLAVLLAAVGVVWHRRQAQGQT
jgi:cell division protein FtsL